MSTTAMPSEPPEGGVPRHDVPSGGRSGFVLLEGRQVHYLEWGHGGLPAVLCLHGGGQTAYMFEEIGAALGRRFHVLAPDLPNHGDSDPLVDRFGPTAIAASVPALLDEFGMTRAALVGASLGGLASVCFGAEHPDRTAAIVLIDVGHRLEREGVRKIVDFLAMHESFASLDEAASEISKYLPHRDTVRPESLSRNLRQRPDGRWEWKHGFGRRLREMPDVDHPAENLESLLTPVRDAAPHLECQVLVLRGAASDVLSEQGAEEVADLIPDARLEVVERAGHLAAGDNPHSTVSLIRSFFDELTW